MKVAILGAGFSGLAAAYKLRQKGVEVYLFEKSAQAGGAAGGFRRPGWKWYLDYAYHHCFTNEKEILELARETGYPEFLVKHPETASLYSGKTNQEQPKGAFYEYLFGKNTSIHKLDSPLDLLRFGRLPLVDRIRTGVVLAALKFGPKLAFYDRLLAKPFLTQTMGKRANQTLWEPLFLKKFAGAYPKINLAFFWARLRRTPQLAYPTGGYQMFANHLLKVLRKQGVKIRLKSEVSQITLRKGQFVLKVKGKELVFARLVNTLQTPLFLQLEKGVLPRDYRQRLAKIKYLGAQNLIIASREKTLPRTYWLSIAAKNTAKKHFPGLDYMVLVQQTNFIPVRYYGNKHLLYLATYTNRPGEFRIKDRKIAQKYEVVQKSYIKYGQPLYTPEFARVKPDYLTPVPGLYFANMELTYPKDRGTNQAVSCGFRVAEKIRVF